MTLSYQQQLGIPFVYGKDDCFSLFRDFYKTNFEIEIPNYARPIDFWKFELDLYADKALKHGFTLLNCHPSEYQPGDVILMAIKSPLGNHVGIIVEKGAIIHHLWGRLSEKTQYLGYLRNSTIGVFRHKAVQFLPETKQIKFNDLMNQMKSPNVL